MKRALGLLLTVVLMTAACGDDDGGVGSQTDPASASTCGELADVTINLLQEAIDSVSDLSVSEFTDLAEMPEAIARLDIMGEDLDARAGDLGCSAEDAQALTCERIGRLEAHSEVAQLILFGIAGSC